MEKLSKHFDRMADVSPFRIYSVELFICLPLQDDDTGPDTPYETIETVAISLIDGDH